MFTLYPVVNPDLQIRGGTGHPDPEMRTGAALKIFFSALRASVLSKNKGRPGPQAPPLDPQLIPESFWCQERL